MGSFIAKQPNGLYCRHSSVVDCVTHWNMTEEDYIEMRAEQAREEARRILKGNLNPFSDVVEEAKPFNLSVEELFERFCSMGYSPTEEDIARWKRYGKEE